MWWIKYLLILISCKSDNALLIRPINIYQSIIAGMYEQYKFDSLTLLHGHTHYSTSEDMELITKLARLQIHFAKLWIPTAIMSIELFKKQEIPRINQLQKPFFVFLNDFDDLKNQLTPEFLSLVAKSERVSLIFFRDETETEKFFENMYIPLDCQFMVSQRSQSDEKYEIITEVYRFAEHHKLQQDFLTSWNSVTEMQLPKMFLHHRRTNFHGHNIKVGWIEKGLFRSPLRQNKSESNTATVIFDEMKKKLNLNITFDMTKYMGNCYSNNTCDYAIGKLVSKKLDIIGEPISTYRNVIKKSFVDYSMTIYQTYGTVFIKKPPRSLKWMTFVELFHRDLWIALGIHMLMTSVAIIFIEYKKKAMFLGNKLQKLIPLNVSDICFRVWAIFNNQSIPYSKYNQIQILQFVAYLLFIFIYAIYSAKLVSFLAADREEIRFHSLQELLLDKTYKIGVTKYSEIYHRLEEIDKKTKYDFFQLYIARQQLSHNSLEGFNRLCQDQKYVFADFRLYSYFFENMVTNSCELSQIETVPYMFSYILQKGTPLKRYLNQIIIKFKERGLYRSLFYFQKNSYPTSILVIDMSHVFPLFVFLGASMVLSIIILFSEINVHKLSRRSPIKSTRIWNIVKWPSKGIYRLRRSALKAKHRRGITIKYNRRR